MDARIPHGVAQLVLHMFLAAEENANEVMVAVPSMPHPSREDRIAAESLRNGFRNVLAHAAVAMAKAVEAEDAGAVEQESALFCAAMLLQEASQAVSLCAGSAVPRFSLYRKAAAD